MDELEYSVKAIAQIMGTNIEGLAHIAGINQNHLKNVSSGRVKMLFEDAKKLSKVSGIPIDKLKEN